MIQSNIYLTKVSKEEHVQNIEGKKYCKRNGWEYPKNSERFKYHNQAKAGFLKEMPKVHQSKTTEHQRQRNTEE